MRPLALPLALMLAPVALGHHHDEEVAGAPAPPLEPSRVSLSVDFEELRLTQPLEELLESAVPLFSELTGRELPPQRALVFNLFESIGTYRRATGAVGISSFFNVGAVTSWRTDESYLAVQPNPHPSYLEAAGWRPELLVQLTLHEGMHQFMARAGMPSSTILPTWYSEGFADYAAERAMRGLLAAPERGFLMLDDAREQVARAVDEGRSIPLAELFALRAIDIDRRADRSLFYDQSRSVVEFLVAGESPRWREAFERYRLALDGLERPDGNRNQRALADRAHELWFEAVEDVEALERDWRASIEPTEAHWLEAHGSSQWSGDELLVAALRWLENGYVLAADPAPKAPERFEAEVRLLGAARGGQVYVVLTTSESGDAGVRLDLSFDQGFGKLVSWSERQVATRGFPIPRMAPSEDYVPVRVDVDGRVLDVSIGEGEPQELTIPEDHPAPGGRWGLGVWKDAALWRSVRYR